MNKAELEARVAELEKRLASAELRYDNSRCLLERQRTNTSRLSGWQECAREFMDRPTTVTNNNSPDSGCTEVAK